MTHRFGQRISARFRERCVVLALALALGACVGQSAQALEVGHARMMSAAGQPLSVVIPLRDLSQEDAATLVVRLADAVAWQQSGLTPPVALLDLNVNVRLGANRSKRDLVVSAPSVPQGDVVDMLLELETSSEQRRIQVSFVVPTRSVPGSNEVRLPQTNDAQIARSVTVRRGDTLSGIAQKHRYAGTDLYQMLAALYQANPRAFMQHNMNWVKAGAELVIPDAATVRAIDPSEARRLFLAHHAAFSRYRAGMAETASVVASGTPESGRLETGSTSVPESSAALGDRVRLSSGTPSASVDQAADEQRAFARAERDIADRVAQLERNIDDISQALSTERGVDVRAESDTAVLGTLGVPSVPDTHSDFATTQTVAFTDSPAAAMPAAQSPIEVLPSAMTAAQLSLPVMPQTDLAPQSNLASAQPIESDQETSQSPRLGWWSENLLVLLTGILAVLALILAWVMRGAGGGSDTARAESDDLTDDDASSQPSEAMRAQFARRLESIDLELSSLPDDSGHGSRR